MMAKFMMPYTAQTYAALRILTGFLFLWHGSQKLFGFPALEMTREMPAFITYGAGSIELVVGLLVMIGLFTRWAAFVGSGTMAAAYWMGHGLDAWLPLQNHGELAALFCFAFLFIAANGSGIWSVEGAAKTAPE